MSELIHTCYRIGDIDRSVAFYEALGFEEIGRMPIRDEAINVFMGFPGDGPRLELTYNFGVDSYDLGTGYNHIAIAAGDLDTTLDALLEQGIEPEKPPYTVSENGPRLCFVRDPDGYRIELIERGLVRVADDVREAIEHSADIAAAPPVVWDLITQPAGLSQWYAFGGAVIDLRPGGALEVRWPEHGVFHGVIDRVDAPRRLEFRWAMLPDTEPHDGVATHVAIDLREVPSGTRVTIAEHGFDKLEAPEVDVTSYADVNLEAWKAGLETLKTIAAQQSTPAP